MRILWIGMAGALGTVARYQLDRWTQARIGSSFPWGTLSVNLLGSFLLAWLTHAGLRADGPSPATRLVLSTGFLGGFTTYAAFNLETLRYLQCGAVGPATAYAAITILGCLGAGAAGWFGASIWPGA